MNSFLCFLLIDSSSHPATATWPSCVSRGARLCGSGASMYLGAHSAARSAGILARARDAQFGAAGFERTGRFATSWAPTAAKAQLVAFPVY